ncbi:MAG: hypothetical protein DIU68_015675 [Chloroflexota bacterium]|nr:MAG: hypothetical protein DIU68_03035 [Chloroflexota bacterium]
MVAQRYLAGLVLAICVLAGCGPGQPAPTAVPFARYSAQQVLDHLVQAGLSVEKPQRDMLVGRDAPAGFSDRYIFEIEAIAPNGGQVLVFNDPARLAEWEAYIERLRARSTTRRDVIYTYVHHNVLLQLNANLMPDVAQAYRDALERLE